MNYQFLKYEATPGEKHLGVATIRAESGGTNFILRFKIVPKKDGDGFFTQPAALKIGDRFVPAFELDSSYEAGELKSFVETSVAPLIKNGSSPSVMSKKPDYPVNTASTSGTSLPMDFGMETGNLPF